MQTFYEEMTDSSVKHNSSLNWLESVRRASKEQIDILQEAALQWVEWFAE